MSKTETFNDEAAAGGSPLKNIALSGTAKRVGVYVAVALAVFLLGLVPMWLKAREAASQRDAARRELRLSRMHGTLASAVIDARRGEYEPARQTVSDFFTALRTQIDAGDDSALAARQREAAAPLLARRDDVITLLARGDPASAEQLSDIYVSYRQAVEEAQVK
ncbi:MAG TPA: hypothetical protein VFS10_01435 [Pyrinomonadaceae bacterium]|nr:hypothetical protein [Pyrinomonadaceae bacterium]